MFHVFNQVLGSLMKSAKSIPALGVGCPVVKALRREVSGVRFVEVEAFETCNRHFFDVSDCGVWVRCKIV